MIACVASVPIRAKSFAPAGRSKTGAKTKTKTTVENKSKKYIVFVLTVARERRWGWRGQNEEKAKLFCRRRKFTTEAT